MKSLSLPLCVALVAGSASLGACSWQEPQAPPSGERSVPVVSPPAPHQRATRTRNAPQNLAVSTALAQIGRPYLYGGHDPSTGFDCSGLVWFAYRSAGVATPRTTAQLWQQLAPVSRGDLRPGDLLFFNINGKPNHVGLYVGDEQFVHAPSSGKSVTLARLDSPYYRSVWLRGARVVTQTR
ncbi:MAG: NlpC/P60 family protein [Pseudomonadota bacterium]